MKSVGPILCRWRTEVRKTQKEVEKETGIPQAYLSDLERGHIREPGIAKTVRLLRALGRTAEELVAELDDTAARMRPLAA